MKHSGIESILEVVLRSNMFHSHDRPLNEVVAEHINDKFPACTSITEVEKRVDAVIRGRNGVEEWSCSNARKDDGTFQDGGPQSRMMGQFETPRRARYIAQKHFMIDVSVRYTLFNVTPKHFIDFHELPLTEEQRVPLNEARDFGLHKGAMIPIRGAFSEISIFSIAGRHFEATRAELLDIQNLATAAHARVKELQGGYKSIFDYGLTERELQVLKLLCTDSSKSSNVIARLIAPWNQDKVPATITVDRWRSNIYQKLGVADGAEAVPFAKLKGIGLVQ